MKTRKFPVVVTSAILMAAPALHAAATSGSSLLRTPPSVVEKMTSQELNDFGLKVTNEVYTALAESGLSMRQANSRSAPQDTKAIEGAKCLYDDDALIQTSTFNHALTKKNYGYSDFDSFQISNLTATRIASDVFVATYYASLPNRVDPETGILFSGESMPRITVVRWNPSKKQWLIFSHADYDTPQAIVCGFKRKIEPEKARFNDSDIKLGRQLIEELVQSKLRGESPNVYAQGYQIVLGSGERNASSKPIASLTKKVEPTNLEAVKSGRLLAIRYDMPNALDVSGDKIAQERSPRLLTYRLNDQGRWELIASAVFGVTSKVAQDIKCSQTGAK